MILEEPTELTLEQEILQLVTQLEAGGIATAGVLDHLRNKTKYTEAQIKSALDGYPYCVDTGIQVDELDNKLAHAYDIRNYYNGDLVDQMLTTWTYWDTEARIVKDMVIDDGIGVKKRVIVHHKENSEPESVEEFTIGPEPSRAKAIVNRILRTLGL